MLLFLRTISYCFPYCFLIVLLSKNSETGYQNAIFFPKLVVESLKKWAPPGVMHEADHAYSIRSTW